MELATLRIPRSHRLLRSSLYASAVFVLSALCLTAQDLPGKIRGYKVHKTNVNIVTSTDKPADKSSESAFVRMGEPTLADIGLYGATIAIGAEITSGGQNGRIEFLMFHDFRIGGIPVEVEDYHEPFSFKNRETVTLPKPIRVSLSIFSVPKAVYLEWTDHRDELEVTGTVFVFGKFKKMGFEFKRVIPVKIDMTIKNPLLHS